MKDQKIVLWCNQNRILVFYIPPCLTSPPNWVKQFTLLV